MKVIFLDIDGELTYAGYENPNTNDIDPEKVRLLKEIVIATDAKIVLSSSWKCGYNKVTGEKRKFYRTLETMLEIEGLSIYDTTEDIPGEFLKNLPAQKEKTMTLSDLEKIPVKFGTGRGAEISKWIIDHHLESFVILDDEDHDWENYGLENHWICPSWYDENGGLNIYHVKKAIQILEEKIMNIKGAPVLWQEGKYAVINNYRNREKPFQLMEHIRRDFGDGTAMLSWEVVDHFEI